MPDMKDIEALIFDVFGTVVDWRTSIVEELEVGNKNGLDAGTISMVSSLSRTTTKKMWMETYCVNVGRQGLDRECVRDASGSTQTVELNRSRGL